MGSECVRMHTICVCGSVGVGGCLSVAGCVCCVSLGMCGWFKNDLYQESIPSARPHSFYDQTQCKPQIRRIILLNTLTLSLELIIILYITFELILQCYFIYNNLTKINSVIS